MKGFFKDFKTFINKGNVVQLAIAVVIGAAFGKIVTSFVDAIISPLLGMALGNVNLSDMALTLNAAAVEAGADAVMLRYGMFIQAIIDFIIIAFFIFIAVRIAGRVSKKMKENRKKIEKMIRKAVTPEEFAAAEAAALLAEAEAKAAQEAADTAAALEAAANAAPLETLKVLAEIRDLLKAQQTPDV